MSLILKKNRYIICSYIVLRPLDAIMWTIVWWRIACSCMNSSSVRYTDVQWNTWVQETNTIDKYKEIVTLMLEDGIMNDGRLLVLNTFTADVSHIHPHMAEDVEQFKTFILSQYCT